MTDTNEMTKTIPELSPPPKVIIGCLAMDQHEAGALLVASFLRDAGADVVYLGRFNLPEHLIRAAIQEDADVIGISCHSWEYVGYLDELQTGLLDAGSDVAIVLGGSIITERDEADLLEKGIAAVVRAGGTAEDIVGMVWSIADSRRQQTRL